MDIIEHNQTIPTIMEWIKLDQQTDMQNKIAGAIKIIWDRPGEYLLRLGMKYDNHDGQVDIELGIYNFPLVIEADNSITKKITIRCCTNTCY
jgi:hypothetical protein